MMSVAMLGGGAHAARYYLERSADCRTAAYYTGRSEPEGRWRGEGATALGLEGRVTGDAAAAFAGLLDGRLPDGTVASRPVWRASPQHGKPGVRVDVRRSGLDLTVSAPKSVSVLYGLAEPAVAAAVLRAHERAVDEAVGYLGRHASHGLRGHQGGQSRAAHITTDGLVAAAFTHRASRAGDPQLHTHLVVTNMLHGSDGQWSAVDSRAIHRHARTAGCVYQACLRGGLSAELSIGWGPVSKGVAEVDGIPRALLEVFSTRRHQITAELERTGGHGRRAAQRAAYRTRAAKAHLPEISLRERWAGRARVVGHDPVAVLDAALARRERPACPPAEQVGRELFGPAGLTRTATSFDRRDVLQSLTEILPAGVPVTGRQLEETTDRLLRGADAIRLLDPAEDGADGGRWSTAELLAAEQTTLARRARSTEVPAHEPHTAARTVTTAGLTAEQQEVVGRLLRSRDTIDVVAGPAGSGKTAALRVAARAWNSQHTHVTGCALAAVTARRLEAATGIPSTSVTRLLADCERRDPDSGRGAGLPAASVVVVDEASMVGTRALASLSGHVAAVGGKLVLVGDPAQLPEIEAGGMFAALAREQAARLSGNVRQVQPWERDALAALRQGDVPAAIAAYTSHQRITVADTGQDAAAQLAGAYVANVAHAADRYQVVALASTRCDVGVLNEAIRGRLRAAGRLGPDTVSIDSVGGERSYATGDLVVVTLNDYRRGLLNGTRATLTCARPEHLSLRTEAGAEIRVPAIWAATHLEHGYAMTVHKAQGLTSDVALLYGTDALCQQAGYVALSRGRAANHIFTSTDSLSPAGRTDGGVPSFELLGPADGGGALDDLAQRLSRSRVHLLARDQRPDFARHEPPDQQVARSRFSVDRGRAR